MTDPGNFPPMGPGSISFSPNIEPTQFRGKERKSNVDTTNDFLVAVVNMSIGIMLPPRGLITNDKALRLAAYIVALADPEGTEFPKVLEAVQNA